jgi:DNA-binding PadR family transcriptional regulator
MEVTDQIKGRNYLIKQRAFLKLYLLSLIEEKKEYALQYFQTLTDMFQACGYQPSRSEIYKSLHELSQDGILKRIKKIKGDPKADFQEVVLYQFTEIGYEKAKQYKSLVRADLDRCIGLLQKAVRDNF